MSPLKKAAPALATLALLVVLVLGYTLYWAWMAERIKAEAHTLLEQAATKGIAVTVRTLRMSGYPGAHTVVFSGRAAGYGALVDFPLLRIRSRFLPGTPLALALPEGFTIHKPKTATLWSPDAATLEAMIPRTFPAKATREDLDAWRQADGKLTVTAFTVRKADLLLSGNGEASLDEALQPAGTLDARLTGYAPFLVALRQQGTIDTRQAILAGTVLSGLSHSDPDTGEDSVPLTLTLQNRTLFAGPLRLATFSPIAWPWRAGPGRIER